MRQGKIRKYETSRKPRNVSGALSSDPRLRQYDMKRRREPPTCALPWLKRNIVKLNKGNQDLAVCHPKHHAVVAVQGFYVTIIL